MPYPITRLVCLLFANLALFQMVIASEPNAGWGSEWKSPAYASDGAALANAVEHLVSQKRYDKALALIERALQDNPRHPGLEATRGLIFSAKGEHRKAISIYSEVIDRKKLPKDIRAGIYTGRAFALYRVKDYRASLEDHLRALEVSSSVVRHNNVAWILATCPEASLRDGKKAIREASIALREPMEDRWKVACLDTLAAAYAEVGDFPNAVRWQEKSVALAASPASRKAGQRRLDLYRKQQPYRQNSDDLQ